ncbi:inositol monophosphatase family protein [Candidatus Altiarchaeota archaeon]
MEDVLSVFRGIGSEAITLLRGLHDGREVVGENPLGQNSLKADVELEKLVVKKLNESGLGGVLETEEQGRVELGGGPYNFVCDPLDGSGNYYRKVPFYGLVLGASKGDRYDDLVCSYVINLVSGDEYWATEEGAFLNGEKIQSSNLTDITKSIAEFDPHEGEVVYDQVLPVLKACKDVRRLGANALGFCFLAHGGTHVFLNLNSSLSAIHAPGLRIAEKAGCVVSDENGGKINPKLELQEKLNFVCSANKELHKQVLELLRK